jgi:hypothetical protein
MQLARALTQLIFIIRALAWGWQLRVQSLACCGESLAANVGTN